MLFFQLALFKNAMRCSNKVVKFSSEVHFHDVKDQKSQIPP